MYTRSFTGRFEPMSSRKYLSIDGESFLVKENEIVNFQTSIENMVSKTVGLTYMDAIIEYCNEKNIDVTSINSLVSPSLKAKLEVEAIRLNMIKNDGEQNGIEF